MNRKAFWVVALVFLLGVTAGAMGFYLASRHVVANGSGRISPVERLTMELSLTPEQQQQVSAILDETKKNYNAIYDPIRPQMEAARREGRQKVRAILKPEQLPKFEEHLRKIDEERAAKRNASK